MFQFAKLLKKGLILVIINKISLSISKINCNVNVKSQLQIQKSKLTNHYNFSSIVAAVASNHEITLIGNDFKGYFFIFI